VEAGITIIHMKILSKIIITALSVMGAAWLMPEVFISNIQAALLVALVLGVLNLTLKPILVILTLPLSVLTLGLFTFVINAFLLWLASILVSGFSVSGVISLFILSLVVSFFSYVGNSLIKNT